MAIGNPINLTSNVEGKNISVIATAGQTQFTVTGGYRINQISVFRNGVRLVDGRDFTATDGATVTLLSAATVADVIEFQVFDDFRVSDALNVNSGGTVNGDVTVTGIVSTTNLSIGSSISLDATSGIVTAVQFIGQMTGTASTATEAEGLTGVPDITVNNIVAAAATFSGVVTYEDITNVDSIGIVTARTGVDITANGLVVNAGVSTFGADLSIADKIIHSGDTNTAIRFPSNDKFTVETAGVQRLEVDSNGDLGLVGIATATGLVVVAGSGGYAGHTGIITAVTFDGNLSGGASGDFTIEDKIVHSGDTNTAIRFPAADTFTVETGGSERIRVDSSGNLGVGENSPLSLFHVKSGDSGASSVESGSFLTVESNGNSAIQMLSGTSNSNFINFGDSGDTNIGVIQYAHSVNALIFKTNASEALRITSGGDVGVGTAAPGTSLHVYHPTTNGVARFESGDANALIAFKDNSTTDNPSVGAIGNDFTIFTASTQRLTIDSSGRIGINDSSPSVTLDITGQSSGNGEINVKRTSGATCQIQAQSSIAVFGSSSNHRVDFKSNSVTAVTIDTGQRLLVGSTSSTSNIAGFGNGGIQLNSTTTAQACVNIIHRNNSDNTHAIVLAKARDGAANGGRVQDDDDFGAISFQGFDGTGGTTYRQGAEIRGAVDGTPGNNDMPGRLEFLTNSGSSLLERARIDSSGRVLIGTTSSRGGNFNNSSGVDAQFQLEGTSFITSFANIVRNSNDENPAGFAIGKSRGTSAGSNTVVQNNDILGEFAFQGSDGSKMVSAADIECQIDGTPGSSDMPGRLMFSTNAGGTGTTERLRIDSRGSFQFSNGFMNETVNINTTARTGTQAVNLDDGMVHYFSTNSSGTWKPNFTMSAGNDINATIATGDVFSPTMIVAKGADTHFANSAEVDGTTIASIEFAGGAPTDGGASGTFDVYNYTIIKTGDDAFKAFISISNYE